MGTQQPSSWSAQFGCTCTNFGQNYRPDDQRNQIKEQRQYDMKIITASVMKIMNRPRIKEKAAAGIIINNSTIIRAIIQKD